jgi:hypothetical protein
MQPPISQKALTLSRKVDECEPLPEDMYAMSALEWTAFTADIGVLKARPAQIFIFQAGTSIRFWVWYRSCGS